MVSLGRRLRLFGHIVRSSLNDDHCLSVAEAIRKPKSDWERPVGRPSHTRLFDLKSIRDNWRSIVNIIICVGYTTVWSGIYECNEYIPLQTVV